MIVLIWDDFVVKSEMKVDFVEKEGSYPLSGNGLLDRADNYLFVSLWLTTTNRELKLEEEGRLVMRS